MDTENQEKAAGQAVEPEGNPAFSAAKEAYNHPPNTCGMPLDKDDPIHDHPDPAISGEPVYPDWVPEGPAFPTDSKEIDMAFGEMTDAKKALMADVKALIYTRTRSPSLCIEMAFLLMGSTVKAVETGTHYSPENVLALLMDNSHLWQGMLLRRVHEDMQDMVRRLGKVPPQQDGPDRELTGVK